MQGVHFVMRLYAGLNMKTLDIAAKDFETALRSFSKRRRDVLRPHWCSTVRDIETECTRKLESFNPAKLGDISQR